MYQCPDCSNQYDKLISLSLHYRKGHKKTAKDLVVKMSHQGQEPTCKCGCGEIVKFLDITRGFSEYVHGHASRVSNNYVNKETQLKSQKTRKEKIITGEWKPFTEKATGEHWSKGKTAETDERVARARATRETPEYKLASSERMSKNRLDGTIPTLSGPAHSQWKGGVSPLNAYCRANSKLYSNWKFPILQASNFSCSKCLKPGPNLEIHHDKETFSEILRKIAKEYKWEDLLGTYLEPNNQFSILLKEQISEAVTNYHIQNNVSGVVLCERCHKKEHNK